MHLLSASSWLKLTSNLDKIPCTLNKGMKQLKWQYQEQTPFMRSCRTGALGAICLTSWAWWLDHDLVEYVGTGARRNKEAFSNGVNDSKLYIWWDFVVRILEIEEFPRLWWSESSISFCLSWQCSGITFFCNNCSSYFSKCRLDETMRHLSLRTQEILDVDIADRGHLSLFGRALTVKVFANLL